MPPSTLIIMPSFVNFFPKIDDGQCKKINSSLNADNCFDNGYLEKLPVGR